MKMTFKDLKNEDEDLPFNLYIIAALWSIGGGFFAHLFVCFKALRSFLGFKNS